MARTIVTTDLIEKMNELYIEIGTYSGVSRALGGSPSPSTVKKYIIPNYIKKENLVIKKLTVDDIPEIIDFEPFKGKDDWGFLCELTEQEIKDIEELWKEISL